jgi:AcrR family transcriptional regulator
MGSNALVKAARGTAKRKPAATELRRAPRQERSQHLVNAILTAAKALVVKHGVDALTTNGLARAAGVSIGSFYQYFPSKRAVLTELRRRHQQLGEQLFRAEAAELISQPVQVATRRFVEQMIAVHRAEPEVHHALEREGRPVLVGEWERQAIQIVRAYLEQHRAELAVTDLDLAAFLVSVATEAITHAAVLERPDLLKDDRLVDGIVRMLLGYLTDRAQ